jgi:hypothetical protein
LRPMLGEHGSLFFLWEVIVAEERV